jgi:c-di-GMP-binding flagellar brake protein YcgR
MHEYVRDEPYEAVALDVSETGLAIRKPTGRIAHERVVGLELELPGTSEIIWASAEPRFHAVNARTHFSGLHFLSMATKHERLIRDYVRERRERLLRLLAPRPVYVSRFGCRFS